MSPETALFLARVGREFWNDPNLKGWYGIKREELFLFITQLTGRENIKEALDLLEEIAEGLTTPTIPPELKELVADLEKLEKQLKEKPGGEETGVFLARVFARWKILSQQGKFQPIVERTEDFGLRTAPLPQTRTAPPEKPAKRDVKVPPIEKPSVAQETTKPQPAPATPAKDGLERVLLTITKPKISLPATLTHFASSLPTRAIKATLDIGREALSHADPNVETFAMLWREGITSKALKTAITNYQTLVETAKISPDALAVLTEQASLMESYEKSHPAVTNLFTFYHRTQEAALSLSSTTSPETAKNAFEIILSTTQRKINKFERLAKPPIAIRALFAVFNNPITRLPLFPFRNISANFLSRLKIASIRAPLEIEKILAPGKFEPLQPAVALRTTGPFYGNRISPVSGSGFAGRTMFSFLGGAASWGIKGVWGAGINLGGGIAAAGGRSWGGAGSFGVQPKGLGIKMGSGLIVLAAVGVFGLIFLPFMAINNHQGSYLGTGEVAGSAYIAIEKNVSPKDAFKNEELPQTITYTITIKPKQEKLTNTEVTDLIVVTNKDGTKSLSPFVWTIPEIATSWNQTQTLDLTSEFSDSLILNTVTVSANVEGQLSRQLESISRTVVVGNPPQECPSGWPVVKGTITQGPQTTSSHKGYEAIDIGGVDNNTALGEPVFTTHTGIAKTYYGDATAGNFVETTSVCEGKAIISRYLHLDTIEITGGPVNKGQRIGIVGQTGLATGPHLHYDFFNKPANQNTLKMAPPYIPNSIPYGCEDNCGVIP